VGRARRAGCGAPTFELSLRALEVAAVPSMVRVSRLSIGMNSSGRSTASQ